MLVGRRQSRQQAVRFKRRRRAIPGAGDDCRGALRMQARDQIGAVSRPAIRAVQLGSQQPDAHCRGYQASLVSAALRLLWARACQASTAGESVAATSPFMLFARGDAHDHQQQQDIQRHNHYHHRDAIVALLSLALVRVGIMVDFNKDFQLVSGQSHQIIFCHRGTEDTEGWLFYLPFC